MNYIMVKQTNMIMERIKQFFATIILLLLCSTVASAHNFEVGGIYYNIISSSDLTVEVTYKGNHSSAYDDEYSGAVVIPQTVTYNSKTYSVTTIGSSAFWYCTGLTSVTIPNSVTSIGNYAFYGCSRLTSVTIPNSVTTIGSGAFYACGLTSVTIPNSVTTIGDSAFDNCSSLTSVTIPNSVTTIGGYAFYNTAWYNNQPDGLVYAGKVLYSYKGTMPQSTSIVIKDGTLGIAGSAFYACGLTSVTIPNSVTSIGSFAFSGCDGLTSVTIPNSVTSIGDDAFSGCDGLTSVTIPNSVTSIGNYAFYACSRLTNITIPNSVTTIGYNVFCACRGLTSVTIPNSVTTIESGAFDYCTGLTSVTIPNSVTTIGEYAFSGCTGLTSVTIGNSVTTIGSYAFYNCSSLKTVCNFSSLTLTAVSDANGYVAYYADKVINAPNGSIEGDYVFGIIDGVNTLCGYIGNGGDIVLPADYKGKNYVIGYHAFWYCTGLTSVTIGNSVTTIGYHAFYNCTGLTSVTIGNSVTTIGDWAFMDCTDLTSIEIPSSVTSIGSGAFCNCDGLTSVAIPNSVTSIGAEAFWGCDGLTSVTIPNSVTTIESGAFDYCTGLTSVTIPNSVTTIGEYAFSNCEELTDIYFASNPTIGDDAIPSGATRHLTLTDSDAADFNTANANTYADVSYTRTISEGKYGTIMLPFAPDEASLQNYAFYTLKEAGDGYIRFEEVAAPAANTPYLYTLRAGAENTAITGGETTIAADIANGTVGSWDLVGSFTNQTIDCTTGNYYAYSAARNEINRITKTLTVLPYRAYFKSTVAQNSNLRVFIGGTTGVTEISPDDIEGFNGGAVYDLYGRPVNEPAKGGVYIINGKKVVW